MKKTVLFLLLSLAVSCKETKKSVDLYLVFDNCDRLSAQVKVLNNDSEIGFVRNVHWGGTKIVAELELNDKIKIPIGSTFGLKEDFLGSQRIEATFSDKTDYYQTGDTVASQVISEVLIDKTMNVDSVLKANNVDSLLRLY
ncbi:MAG: hypothetical protein KF845_10435 [Cyclobacteriaceae bacterium]|nr:hypothetical protein [Cyclobacteriaceae bacterium]